MSALEEAILHPPLVPGVAARNELQGLRRRSVSRADIVAHSVASVAPAMGALSTALATGVIAGRGAWISIILAAAISWGVARSLGEFGSRLAGSGSLYTFVARSGFRYVALVVAVLLVVGYGAFAMAGLGFASNHVLAAVSAQSTTPVFSWTGVPWTAGAALICVAVIIVGVRATTRMTLVTECAGVLLLIVLMSVALAQQGGSTVDMFDLHDVEWGNVWAGTVIMVGGWVGFESSAALGAEAKRPFASVPRAMTFAVLFAGGIYLAAWFSQLASLPLNYVTTSVLHISLALCFLAAVTAFWTALTRMLFLFGREGILPRWLGRTHPKLQTPHVAAAVSFVPLAGGAIVLNYFGLTPGVIHEVAAPALMSGYIITTVVLLVFLSRLRELSASVAVLAGFSAALMAAVLAENIRADVAGNQWFQLGTVVCVCISAWVWMLIIRWRKPTLLDNLGKYDNAVAADLLGAAKSQD